MIFHITLNGVKVTKEIPESWDKVTFRQCLAHEKVKNDFPKVVSLFTGIDEATLLKAQIHNLPALEECLSFRFRAMEYTMPDNILDYQLPKNLEIESIAQYADIQEIAKNFTEDEAANIEKFPLIVATYCVKPYDFKEAEKIAEKLFDAPCLEVTAAANFTLARLLASKLRIPNPFLRVGTRPNKLRRVMISWLNRLDFTIRYSSWSKALPSPVRNYLTGR